MYKKAKPITLNRETLRMLDPRELSHAQGGLRFSFSPCNPNSTPVTRCGDGCATYSCPPGTLCF
jgi:hypothetical protein